MNFLETIVGSLAAAADRPVLGEVRDGRVVSVTGAELLALIQQARSSSAVAALRKGDRCALLAHNSIRWTALDLALMAEGILVVPLYARQSPRELVAMMKDCSPRLLCCGDAALREAVTAGWPEAPRTVLLEELFATPVNPALGHAPRPLGSHDPMTIIYTSGTSGEAKGVVLNVANLNHMLPCTIARLNLLMGRTERPDRVFHYLPCCFAGSWILLLTSLLRGSQLLFSTDLTKLVDEMKLAAPDYFLNVPALLERVRAGVEEKLANRGGLTQKVFTRALAAGLRQHDGHPSFSDRFWLGLGRAMVFPAIRRKLGPDLKALICGSAPLACETQLFFLTLGLPVLQVYGLTETTAICTLDHPHHIEPGRVGPAVPEVGMRLGENDEILVRGPNVFPGYWNRPEETGRVLRGGWFHTGDQGEVNAAGNWRILGRIKNLIVLGSGHNVAPEPLEDLLLRQLPGAQQVVLMGTGRGYLTALVAGATTRPEVQAVLDRVNPGLPHYQRIRAFHLHPEAFTIESGLLTANGKLRRDAIAARFATEIEELYAARAH